MAATALAPVELDRVTRHRILIAAAVAAVLGGNARVLAIEPANAWTLEGRATVHLSHAVFRNANVVKTVPKIGARKP